MINLYATKSELNNLELQWQVIKIKKNNADRLRNQISDNKEILNQLKGIRNSRLEWNKQLINFMATTPDSIQFRKLSISQTVQLNEKKQATRTYKVSLEGKATGDKVDITVAGFTKTLSTDPRFSPYIELAQVTNYDKDHSPNAKKNDRIFTIDCNYKSRIFE